MAEQVNPQTLQEIRGQLAADLPYDIESMFRETEGFSVRRANKAKIKQIRNCEERLRSGLLEPDEQIKFVAQGQTPGILEQLFIGVLVQFLNLHMFFFTTKRILIVNGSTGGKPYDSMWQIRYEWIRNLSQFLTTVTFEYIDGSKKRFLFRGRDRKNMEAITRELKDGYGGAENALEFVDQVQNLCPRCYKGQQPKEYKCRFCGQLSCTPTGAAWRSAILPPWGSLYLKHRMLAVMEVGGEVVIWGLVGLGIATGKPESIAIGAVIFALDRVVDVPLSAYMAKKGLIPTDSQ